MAKPIIGDVFIGNFPITQQFGDNPDNYKKFGLKGHDGIDFGVPSSTQIVSATNGIVIKKQFDPSGYGWFIEIWDNVQNCATLYGHLQDYNGDFSVKVGDKIVQGQCIGYSDNTGNSTGPHLHFGFCLTDANGIKLNQDNGFFGWLNPDTEAIWDIKNITKPVDPTQPSQPNIPSITDQTKLDLSQIDDVVNPGKIGVVEFQALKSMIKAWEGAYSILEDSNNTLSKQIDDLQKQIITLQHNGMISTNVPKWIRKIFGDLV